MDAARAEYFNIMREVFLWTLRIFNKKVSIAIAASSFAKKEIERVYGFDPNRVFALNNGADELFKPASTEMIAEVKQKYKLPETFFLNVSRLNPSKNAFRTIRAFDIFASAHPDSTIHFVNVGNYGTEIETVYDFISRSPHRERIHLIGYVEAADLPAVYSAAFAFVFPLLNDGFGLPVIEAMACGTPTVISQTASPEITSADAILVDALSENSIANGMSIAYEDKALRARLIHNGFVCREKYSWRAMQDKLIALYKGLELTPE